jgi:hypothetical protein
MAAAAVLAATLAYAQKPVGAYSPLGAPTWVTFGMIASFASDEEIAAAVKFKFKSRSGIVAGTGKVVKLPPKNPGPGENRLTVKYVRKIVKLAPQAVNQEVLISPYTSQCKLVSR